ncbi:MAG: phosphatase PAP2 family protein [Clostridia bacterium]|nr:phosphatase PAP2 family protein [Clostridia bacterium]
MENILKTVYENKRLFNTLLFISHFISALSVVAAAVIFVKAFFISPFSLIKLAIILGIPFIAVSIIRKLLNKKRPYEIYDFYEIKPKKREGLSFPSRHAHSFFAVSLAVSFFYPILFIPLLILGLALCTFRVLLGIHFIRDVVTGALTGTISTILGFLILSTL